MTTGLNILRTTPLALGGSFNNNTIARPVFSNLLLSHHFPIFPSTSTSTSTPVVTPSISIRHHRKRGFRGGAVAAMAQKSEEEWRAVLSPEQFRILRQKGTE